jgi:conjugal transfer pilus assembly protein TraU
MRALLMALTLAIGVITARPALASSGPGRCTGHFVNPITDICWSCLFPISIGGLKIWPSSRWASGNRCGSPMSA